MCVYLGVCVQNKKEIHIHMKLFCGMEILNSFTKTLKLKPYIERKKKYNFKPEVAFTVHYTCTASLHWISENRASMQLLKTSDKHFTLKSLLNQTKIQTYLVTNAILILCS